MGRSRELLLRTVGVDRTDASAADVILRLRRLIAIAALVLSAVTWKLWGVDTEFPRIPLVSAAASVPDAVQRLFVAGMLAAVFVAAVARDSSRWWKPALLVFAACLTALIVCDQQRLQAWAYQFVIMAAVMALVPARRAMMLLQLFVASIYLHSALSKFSMTFLKGTGPQLLEGLLRALRLPESIATPAFDTGLEVLFPLGELVIAILLVAKRTRKVGVPLSVAMHLLLLLTLGPLGLSNRPGVLVWNIYFIFQNVYLFGERRTPSLAAENETESAPSISSLAANEPRSFAGTAGTVLATAAIFLPFLEPVGLYDHWPSWAVYAGSAERVKIYVPIAAREKLPPSLRPWLFRPTVTNGMSRVAIDRWAIDVFAAPIYPEDRYQLGVALWIARQAGLEDAILVSIESRASRWKNQRTTRQLRGAGEIARELETFRWNGFPREPADRPSVSAERSEPQ